MAYTYNIQSPNIDNGEYQSNPNWVLLFIRFDHPASFDRNKPVQGKFYSKSLAEVEKNPTAELPSLIVQNDCISWNTSTSKGSHVSGASFTLVNSGIDYSQEVSSGDFAVLWAHNNTADSQRIIDILKNNRNNQQANKFMDGLKFIGRVSSVSRKASRDAGSGVRTVFYTIDANGFTDLDAQIYYDDAIAIHYQDANAFLVNVLGATIDQFKSSLGFVTTQDVIPILIKVLLGLGTVDTQQKNLNLGSQDGPIVVSPNKGYRIPKTLANILFGSNFPTPNNTVGWTYSDILKIIIGVQKYDTTTSFGAPSASGDTPAKGFFNDDLWSEINPGVFKTGTDITAKWSFDTISFNNTSVWGIIERFINKPIDEVYTCLRVFPSKDPSNKLGEIYPTLVCRQVPLNTDIFVKSGQIAATSFFEVPRWKIDKAMVVAEDFTKTEMQRINYVHLYGTDLLGQNSSQNDAAIKSAIAPVYDSADIQRHGLRAMIRVLPVDAEFLNSTGTSDQDHPGAYWSALVADQLIDGQNKFTGTLSCKGIQEPIVEGDNLEYDNLLFHIERVAHAGQINLDNGMRTFNTVLQLSNGLAAVQSDSDTLDYGSLPEYGSNSDPEPDANAELRGVNTATSAGDDSGFGIA